MYNVTIRAIYLPKDESVTILAFLPAQNGVTSEVLVVYRTQSGDLCSAYLISTTGEHVFNQP